MPAPPATIRPNMLARLGELIPDAPVLLLGGAALAFYTAARAGASALAGRENPLGPRSGAGARAIAHWLPMAAVTLLAVWFDPQMSVSIVFAGAVACLSLAVGTVLFASPMPSVESDNRRAWGMILPAAMLALLAGFSGELTVRHAAILALQGAVALLLWISPARDHRGEPGSPTISPAVRPTDEPGGRRGSSLWIRGMGAVAWIGLTLVGALLALRATGELTARLPRLSAGLVGTLMLAPALALPLIGSGLALAREDRAGTAVSTCVGCALLNLCLLLPGVILVWHFIIARESEGTLAATRASLLDSPTIPLGYPMAVWRVDTVLLVMLGALLVPISAGRWRPRRAEGLGLLIIYALYMWATAGLAGRG